MTIRSFTFVLTAVGALALVACKSETGTNVGGGNVGGTGGNTGGGGEGGSACADSCASAITDGGEPCSGTGDSEYSALVSCAETECGTDCSGLIAGGASDSACGACLQANCSPESDACANN
ncbi:hypothetical protein A7982_13001 [Minicystis rosea]|nr:hypothetical protein A7982_13001 [Minicystis rosea]